MVIQLVFLFSQVKSSFKFNLKHCLKFKQLIKKCQLSKPYYKNLCTSRISFFCQFLPLADQHSAPGRDSETSLKEGSVLASNQQQFLIFAVVPSISHRISAILRLSRIDISLIPRILIDLLPCHGCDMSAQG